MAFLTLCFYKPGCDQPALQTQSSNPSQCLCWASVHLLLLSWVHPQSLPSLLHKIYWGPEAGIQCSAWASIWSADIPAQVQILTQFCRPHGRPKSHCRLPASARPSPGCCENWRGSWNVEDASLSLFHLFSPSTAFFFFFKYSCSTEFFFKRRARRKDAPAFSVLMVLLGVCCSSPKRYFNAFCICVWTHFA